MRKIAKSCLLAVLVLMCLNLSGCVQNKTSSAVQVSSKKYNIAVISAMNDSSEFETFCDKITQEFNNIGYNVDTFSAKDDKEYLNSLLSKSLNGGYVGVVLYDINDYAEKFAKEAQERNVACVVFSKSDLKIPNVPIVSYNQSELVKLSVDELVKQSDEDEEFSIVKVWCNSEKEIISARVSEFDKYIASKGIKKSLDIYEKELNLKSGLSRNSKEELKSLPNEGFNYIWVADDDMAAMVSEYLKEESINNASVVCVGMSRKNISKMYEYENYWQAASAVSFNVSAVKCAEVLSRSIEKKTVDFEYKIPAVVLRSNMLDENSSIDAIEKLSEERTN